MADRAGPIEGKAVPTAALVSIDSGLASVSKNVPGGFEAEDVRPDGPGAAARPGASSLDLSPAGLPARAYSPNKEKQHALDGMG